MYAGLHQQSLEGKENNWTLYWLTTNFYVHLNAIKPVCRLSECGCEKQELSLWRAYLLMVLPQEVEFLFQAVQVTTECGDDLVMVWLGFLQGHAVSLHRLTHCALRLPSANTHSLQTSKSCSKYVSKTFWWVQKSHTHLILKSSAASLALSISSMIRAFSRVFFLTCKIKIKMKVHVVHLSQMHWNNQSIQHRLIGSTCFSLLFCEIAKM